MKSIKLGLIGYPLSHSISPLIHNHWLKQEGLTGDYELFPIKENSLDLFFKELKDSEIIGLNVTIPYKEKVIKYIDEIDIETRNIGSINTILIKDNKTYGFNTDDVSFIKGLEHDYPEWSLKDKTVTILGSGGSARAICNILKTKGVSKINVTSRNSEKLEAFCNQFRTNNIPWNHISIVLKETDLLINCTPLGMQNMPELHIDLTKLKDSDSIVYDIVFNPLPTALLKKATSLNYKTINGLGMLVYQAQKSFEIWTKINPQITNDLFKHCHEALKQ